MVATRFVEVVETLSTQILDGTLAAGSRLPTQYELADRYGMALATANRVYRELRQRGLAIGEVGRGTFVRGPSQPISDDLNPSGARSRIDLAMNAPILAGQQDMFRTIMRQVLDSNGWSDALLYHPSAGRRPDREAAAGWYRARGLEARPEHILITSGAQHAIFVSLMVLCRPSDVVAVEELTYPGLKILAAQHHLKLAALPMDEEGIVPDALDAACRRARIRALYCMPTVQNPIGCVMSDRRRDRIVEICERHDVTIIEDDAYAFLDGTARSPLRERAPDRCINIQSMSKAFVPGLRIGYMLVPPHLVGKAEAFIRGTTWLASPVMAAVASRWIASGEAGDLVKRKQADAAARQAVARSILSSANLRSHPTSYHMWMTLPEGLRSDDLVRDLDERGVGVSGASAFSTTARDTSAAIRIALGTPPIDQLFQGLGVLAEAVVPTHRRSIPTPA